MAYLDLEAPEPARFARSRREAALTFDRLDEAALEVARHDGLRTLRRHGRVMRFVERLLGLHVTPPLADPRLEALRRLGVAARLGGRRLAAREAEAARAAGFTPFQVDAVLARFGLAPAFQRN